MKIHLISSSQIKDSLIGNHRQYLVGNLQIPQSLEHFDSKDLEIGISSYVEDASELPHYHHTTSEYIYLIKGHTRYFDVETKEIYEFRTGDFFIIQPYTTYAQKIKAGTELLFIKYPPGNDKITVDCTKEASDWLKEIW